MKAILSSAFKHLFRPYLYSALLGVIVLGSAPSAADPASANSTPAPSREQLLAQAGQCREILRTSLVQFYLPACLDKARRGYLESLRDNQFVPTGEKFLTLQSRQLWFFSTLALDGFEKESALDAARNGFDFLQTKMRDARHGGYFSKVTDAGEPKDTRKHVYLNSFALYGLVAYFRASRDPAALAAAQELFRILDAKTHDEANGGYHEFFYADWRPVTDPKESGYVGAIGAKTYNTHLHLLESFAELYRAWPDPLVRRRVEELIHINTTTVQHPDFNCNIDGWHPDWRVVETPRNLRASYGHDVECVWLTFDAARTIGLSPRLFQSWAESLCSTSIKFGYDRQHGGFYYTGPLGQASDDTKKEWWTQAEALVSMLEMYQLTGKRDYYDIFGQTLNFVAKYQVAKEGSWWATRLADGSPSQNTQRSSTWQGAYHNGRAMVLCAKLLEQFASNPLR